MSAYYMSATILILIFSFNPHSNLLREVVLLSALYISLWLLAHSIQKARVFLALAVFVSSLTVLDFQNSIAFHLYICP